MRKIYIICAVLGLFITGLKSQTLLTESFEGAFPPTGWSIIKQGNANNWQKNISGNAYDGNACLNYTYSTDFNANAWAISPALNLNGNTVTISFYVKTSSSFYLEALKLTAGTTNTIAGQTTTLIDTAGISNVNYRRWSTTFVPPAAGTYYFGWNCYSIANNDNLFVDSITIVQSTSSCNSSPTGGNISSSFSSTCAGLPFSLQVANATSGISGLKYQWETSLDGTNWSVNAADTNKTLNVSNGINAATYYRRKIICGVNSDYSSVFLMNINPSRLCLCSPLNGTTLHSNPTTTLLIDTIQLLNTSLSYASSAARVNNYTYNADSLKIPNLRQAANYTLNIKLNNVASNTAMWIDWNQNGIFDTSEYYVLATSSNKFSYILTIPGNALLGKTIMRVRTVSNTSTLNKTDACTSFTIGETEDFIINVTLGIPCDPSLLAGGSTAANDTSLCRNVGFNLSVINSTRGLLGLSYQWQSSTDNITWNDIAGANDVVYNVPNGLQSSMYYRRKISCGATDTFSSPLFITVTYCYCGPNTNTIINSGGFFELDSINISSTKLAISNITSSANFYNIFASQSTIPDLRQGVSYTLNLLTTNSASSALWIDWNLNGAFDAGEYQALSTVGGFVTTTFQVPSSAVLGQTVMRIRVVSNSNTLSSTNSCTRYFNGNTYDFVLNILPGIPCAGIPLNGGTISISANNICSGTSFLLSSNGVTTGYTGLVYQWQSSVDSINWTNINAANSLSLNLSSGVSVSTYFRLSLTCGATSALSNVTYVKITPAYLCACSPTLGTNLHFSPGNPSLDSVQIQNTKLVYKNTGVNSIGYKLINDTNLLPTLIQSGSYSLSVTNAQGVFGSMAVYADWNQNGIFEQSEFTNIGSNITNGTINLSVPANALTGISFIRIRTTDPFVTLTANDGCTFYNSGETIDFLVKVNAGIPCSSSSLQAGVAIASSNLVCSSSPFTLNVQGNTIGFLGLTYQWQQSVNGVSWSNIANANSINLNTTTTSSLYYRLQTTCSGSTVSSQSVLVNLQQNYLCPCSPLRSTSLHFFAGNPGIDSVRIFSTSLNYRNTNITSTGYKQITDTLLMPTLQQALSYNLRVRNSTIGDAAIWIDLNRNGIFEASEFIASNTAFIGNTFNIQIPQTATIGRTLMRIRVTPQNNGIGSTSSCAQFFGGETIDFLVNIVAGTACSSVTLQGGTSIASDTIVCRQTAFTLSVKNASTNVIGLGYRWQASANNVSWVNLTGTSNTFTVTNGILANTYYRLAITCGTTVVYSTPVYVQLKTPILCACSPNTGTQLHFSPGNPNLKNISIANSNFSYNNLGVATNGYRLFTDTNNMAILQQALTYQLKVSLSINGNAAVWFDWNRNGSYETNEFYGIISNSDTAGTISVIVPATATVGLTGMRIRVVDQFSTLVNSGACNNYFNGETKDFICRISAGVPCSTSNVNAGTVSVNKDSVCSGTPFVLTSNNGTTGVINATSIWQTSTNGVNFSNVPNQTTTIYNNTGVSTTTYFRYFFSCQGVQSLSNIVKVSLNPTSLCVCGPNTGQSLHINVGPNLLDSFSISGTYNKNTINTKDSYVFNNEGANTPTVNRGGIYDLFTKTNITSDVGIWADFNRNGSFETTEFIGSSTSGNANVTMFVPSGASLGRMILRVRALPSGSQISSFYSCFQLFSGQTQDFIINVAAGTPCTSTITPGTTVSDNVKVCSGSPFNLSVQNATIGLSGMTYLWQYSLDSISWFAQVGETKPFYTVTTGITQTTYYRLRIGCGTTLAFSKPIKVELNPTSLCPCSPFSGSTLHFSVNEKIDSTFIVGTNLSYPAASKVHNANYYNLYSNSTKVPNLKQGNVYTLNYYANTTSCTSGVWIDWNQDGVFDFTEFITLTKSGNNFTSTFIVPSTASLGNCLMRIRVISPFNSMQGSDACTGYFSGETDDYLLNITQGTACTPSLTGGTTLSTSKMVCSNQSFVLSVKNSTTGFTGLTYQWQSSNDNINWFDISNETNFTSTVNFLFSNTYYRVKISCGINSVYSTPVFVQVAPSNLCVCSPLSGTTLNSINNPALDSVKLLNTIINVKASGNLYNLSLDSLLTADVTQGKTYFLYVKSTASSTAGNAYAWFDWNADGFGASDEFYTVFTNAKSGLLTFKVPVTSTTGKVIMRIRLTDINNTLNYFSVCSYVFSGVTEDYVVNIKQGPSCTPNSITGGQAYLQDSIRCFNAPFNVYIKNDNDSVVGQSYQWQSLNNNVWTNLFGQTNPVLNLFNGVSAATSFRRNVTCSSSTKTSAVVLVSPKPPVAPYAESFEKLTTYGFNQLPSCWNFYTSGSSISSSNAPVNGVGARTGNAFFYTNYFSRWWTITAPVTLQKDTIYTFQYYFRTSNVQTGANLSSYWGNSSDTNVLSQNLLGTLIDINSDTGYTSVTYTFKPLKTDNYYFGVLYNCPGFGPLFTYFDDFSVSKLPACSGTPNGGDVRIVSITPNCQNANVVITVDNSNVNSGLSYKWQQMVNNKTWTDIQNSNISTLTKNDQTSDLYYRRLIYCNSLFDSSSSVLVNVLTDSFMVPYVEDFEGLGNFGQGVLPICMRSVFINNDVVSTNQTVKTIKGRASKNFVYTLPGSKNWLITPKIYLKANAKYSFKFFYQTSDSSKQIKINSYFNASIDTTSLKQNLIGSLQKASSKSNFSSVKYNVSVPISGNYYFALEVINNDTAQIVAFDDFMVDTIKQEPLQQFYNLMPASLVVGQTDFFSSVGGVNTANGLNSPSYAAISSKGVLAVASQAGRRVQIWNNFKNNGQNADVVVGKTSFTDNTIGCTDVLTNIINGVAFSPDGNKLLVADYLNRRVLIWNTIPKTNGQPADVVVGQPNFLSNTAAISASGLTGPTGLFVTNDGKLLVSDNLSNRVLIWNAIPTSNGQAADVVIGQSDFISSNSGLNAFSLNGPWGIWVAPNGELLIADVNNNRILVWNKVPTTNGVGADVVIGQSNFFSSFQSTSSSNVNLPIGVTVSPDGTLAVGEFSNHRVLLFDSIPVVNGAAATTVLGQPDYFTSTPFYPFGSPTEYNFNNVYNCAFDYNGRLFVTGRAMNRTMVFGQLPTDSADLTLAINGTTTSLCNNSNVSYTVSVRNKSRNTSATNVSVSTQLPAAFTLSNYVINQGVYTTQTGKWFIDEIKPNQTVTITLTGTVNTTQATSVTAYAAILQSAQIDSNLNDNTGNVVLNIVNGTPPTGGVLTGADTVTVNTAYNYIISGMSGATTYNWTVNGNATTQNKFDTLIVTPTLANSSIVVTVYGANTTCSGNVFVKNVFVKPAAPVVNTISGSIVNTKGQAIKSVSLVVSNGNTTTVSSNYSVSLNAGGSYVVKATKNNDVVKTNGVSTIDIALVQSHILQKNILNSPYKIIAADVNSDKKVTTLDIVFMRRLILGTDSLFPGKKLWVFIDSSYQFANATNPFPFKDSFVYTGLNVNYTKQNFLGIKLGDVNWDWNPNLSKATTKAQTVQLQYQLQKLNDDRYKVPVTVRQFKHMLGVQFALQCTAGFDIVDVTYNPLQFAFNNKANGIAMIWNDKENAIKSLRDDEVLFELWVKKWNTELSDDNFELQLQNNLVPTEAWDGNFVQHPVLIQKQTTPTELVSTTLQVSPNPTKGQVVVKWYAAQKQQVYLYVTDIQGKQVAQFVNQAKAGLNEWPININSSKKLAKGVYFISLSAEATKTNSVKLMLE